MPNEKMPLHLISGFQRCMNYPKDELGLLALAKGLQRAAMVTQVGMAEIVDACMAISMYCPTDAELMVVAKNLREDRERDNRKSARSQWHAEMRAIYGEPRPFSIEEQINEPVFWAAVKVEKERQRVMWQRLYEHFSAKYPGLPRWKLWARVSWRAIYRQMTAMGEELTPEQRRVMDGEVG